jgi:ABC-type Fe3+-hydroxamate transport system substrate-binding protein
VHPVEWSHSKPRVGGTKKVDVEKVRTLMPDLIIGNKEENSQVDIELLEKEFPVWMSDVRDLAGALAMIERIGGFTQTLAHARPLAERIAASFSALRPVNPPLPTAYLLWWDPLMAAGRDTFIHDMLMRCGLGNVFADHAGRYPTLDESPGTEEELDGDPQLVLCSSEPFPFKAGHLVKIQQRFPKAKVLRVDGEMFSWYGSRLLKAVPYFRSLIDGLRAEGIGG